MNFITVCKFFTISLLFQSGFVLSQDSIESNQVEHFIFHKNQRHNDRKCIEPTENVYIKIITELDDHDSFVGTIHDEVDISLLNDGEIIYDDFEHISLLENHFAFNINHELFPPCEEMENGFQLTLSVEINGHVTDYTLNFCCSTNSPFSDEDLSLRSKNISSSNSKFKVFNVNGAEVGNEENNVDFLILPSGIYFIIEYNDGRIISSKSIFKE